VCRAAAFAQRRPRHHADRLRRPRPTACSASRSGADDYIAKPFSTRELLARVRAVVRRARGLAGPGQKTLRVGPLLLEPGNLRVDHRRRRAAP
jgi:DNA-binding response OmpR family regulator